MKRSQCFLICLIVIWVSSCNNKPADAAGMIPEEEKQLRSLIAQYPDSLLLKENLIQYFRVSDNYGEAISVAKNALAKDSLNDRLLDIKATLYFENGDTVNAIKDFEKAIAINPQPEYIISLGSLYAQTKNPLALALSDALLQTPAANAQKQAIFIKGLYYSYTGDKLKAIEHFDFCLKIDYRDILAYREKAICLYDLGKYEAALDVLQKSVAIQNTFDEGYYWMGRCYEKLDKRKEAIEHYQMALQIDPNYIEAKDALGKLGIK
jgi:tetratricopeptide (TPR) repeat protein